MVSVSSSILDIVSISSSILDMVSISSSILDWDDCGMSGVTSHQLGSKEKGNKKLSLYHKKCYLITSTRVVESRMVA